MPGDDAGYAALIPAIVTSAATTRAPDFGLGQAERVEAIEVLWPDGTAEAFPGQSVDQMVVLRKGAGKPVKR